MSAPRIAGRAVAAALGAVAALGAAGLARAEPLNVTDFASLGAFPTAAGTYTFNTSGTPTLTGPGGLSLTGVVGPDDIAVFTFDAILVGSGMTLTGSGARPLALLSYGDVTITGTGLINVSGGNDTGGRPWRARGR